MKADLPSCDACLYKRQRVVDGEVMGDECRRYPPIVVTYIDVNQESIPMSLFPQVDSSDWCAEFRGAQ